MCGGKRCRRRMLNCSGAAQWWCKFESGSIAFWDFAADSNTQTRVQLQENLEGEDNIHVNLIQYHHSLAICSTIFHDFPIFSSIFMYCFFEWQPKWLRAATQVCGHGARRNLSCQRHLRGASAGSSAKVYLAFLIYKEPSHGVRSV